MGPRCAEYAHAEPHPRSGRPWASIRAAKAVTSTALDALARLRPRARAGPRLALWAVAAGLLGAVALSGALAGLLYGVDPLDPPTLGAAAVALTLIALAASYGPARRATRVDPLVALRRD